MKSITSILLSAIICLNTACKNNTAQPGAHTAITDSATQTSYMPVADFIKNDIKRVDSFAGGILYRTSLNGKKDSGYIQGPAFHRLASRFLLSELDSVFFHRHFTENALMDATTQMLNFIYTAKEADLPLQKAIVYIKPGTANDKVNRIYIERAFSAGDTLVQQKLTWKTEEYFYILTIRQPKTGPAVTSMEKVIWDPRYFAEE